MSEQLWQRTAGELADLISSKQVSSREVIDSHLERIEEVNGHLNAVTVTLTERAQTGADAADAAVAAGKELGPLHGVPFTIKENIDVAGTATTSGVPAFAELVSEVDSPLVERMTGAGAVPLGRTNLPEMGLRVSTNNPLRGLTRNPWHPGLTAGGSSGGEGSALGSGMTPIGLGNDIGGSVRNPAFCNGVASLKPTHGRLPRFSSFEHDQNDPLSFYFMGTDGPMARSVDDLWTAMAILNGRDARDPRSVTVAMEGPDSPKKAAILREVPGGPCDPWVIDGVNKAAEALAAQGWEITEATPPEMEHCQDIWGHLLARDVELMMQIARPMLSEGLATSLDELGENFPAETMPPPMVQAEFVRLSRDWSTFFAEHPVLVMPTWTTKPFEHDADLNSMGIAGLTNLLRCITPPNILNLPAACVPVGVSEGLAQGVQCVADRWRDDLALTAAGAIETQLGIITPIDPVV
jgi:amidase